MRAWSVMRWIGEGRWQSQTHGRSRSRRAPRGATPMIETDAAARKGGRHGVE
jgi:hypothetical protein